jgi:hypothetical protein
VHLSESTRFAVLREEYVSLDTRTLNTIIEESGPGDFDPEDIEDDEHDESGKFESVDPDHGDPRAPVPALYYAFVPESTGTDYFFQAERGIVEEFDDEDVEADDDEDAEKELKKESVEITVESAATALKALPSFKKIKTAEEAVDAIDTYISECVKYSVENDIDIIEPDYSKLVEWALKSFPKALKEDVRPWKIDRMTDLKESFEFLNEGRPSVTFSRGKGRIVKLKKCPAGWKLVGNKCVMQSGQEKVHNRLTGIKIKRAAKAQGGAVKKMANIKRRITKKMVKGRARSLTDD